MKKNWVFLLTLTLCVLLGAGLLMQNQFISGLQADYETQAEETIELIEDLKTQVEALQAADPVTPLPEGWNVTGKSVDLERKEITIEISGILNRNIDRITAHSPGVLPVKSVGFPSVWPEDWTVSRGDNGAFSAELTLPWEEKRPIALTAFCRWENGKEYPLALGTWVDMTELLPIWIAENCGEMGYSKSGDGRLYIVHRSVKLSNGAAVENPMFRLLKNGQVEQEVSAEAMDEPGAYSGYPLEMLGGLPCVEGDRVELQFTCTDQFGLQYEFTLNDWEIVASWQATECWLENRVNVVWP